MLSVGMCVLEADWDGLAEVRMRERMRKMKSAFWESRYATGEVCTAKAPTQLDFALRTFEVLTNCSTALHSKLTPWPRARVFHIHFLYIARHTTSSRAQRVLRICEHPENKLTHFFWFLARLKIDVQSLGRPSEGLEEKSTRSRLVLNSFFHGKESRPVTHAVRPRSELRRYHSPARAKYTHSLRIDNIE